MANEKISQLTALTLPPTGSELTVLAYSGNNYSIPLSAFCLIGVAQTITANKTYSGLVSITNSTASTSPTTGALTVSGGVGIAGDLFISGTANGIVLENTQNAPSEMNILNGNTGTAAASWFGASLSATSGATLVMGLDNGASPVGYFNTGSGIPYWYFEMNGTTILTLTKGGGVQIGAPSLGDQGAGTLTTANTITAYTSSNSTFSGIICENGNSGTSAVSQLTANVNGNTAIFGVSANGGSPVGYMNTSSGLNELIIQVNGTNVLTMVKSGGLQIGSPTGGDKGAGTVNSAGGFFTNGVAVGSSAITLLNTLTPSGVASVQDTSSLTSSYTSYLVVFENIIPATNNTTLELELQVSSTFQTSGYVAYVLYGGNASPAAASSTAYIPLASPGNSYNAAPGISGSFRIFNPSASAIIQVEGTSVQASTSSAGNMSLFGGYYNTSGAVTGLKFLFSSGNITSGTIKIYGIS